MSRDLQFYVDVDPDAPKVCVHSIPHTGTRFVVRFFKEHGTPIWHRHLYDKPQRVDWKRIIPVRNPYDCWKSWVRKRRHNFTDLWFVSMWAEFIMRTEHQDAFYFPMDVEHTRRQWVLMGAVDYIGAERNMAVIKDYAKRWKPVGASLKTKDKVKELLPKEIEEALGFANEWYQHYTVFYGEHVRNSKNMIGEYRGGN